MQPGEEIDEDDLVIALEVLYRAGMYPTNVTITQDHYDSISMTVDYLLLGKDIEMVKKAWVSFQQRNKMF